MEKLHDPALVIKNLLSPTGAPSVYTLSVSQFREVYTEIQKARQGTPVHILLNGDWAMVQFSRLCNHRIRIISDAPLKPFSWIERRKILEERDFEFASLHAEFLGVRKQLTIWKFLWEELITNGLYLLGTFLISFVAFSALTSVPSGKDALQRISEALLTASTLYLSVFILFTVSQNAEVLKDNFLFRKGLTYRFFQVDKILASLSVYIILSSILNIVLINISSETIRIFLFTIKLPDLSIYIQIFSALIVTTLVDCFLSLIRYYFQRTRLVSEKDLTKNFFDELYEDQNKDE
jgi:hypothetical protein